MWASRHHSGDPDVLPDVTAATMTEPWLRRIRVVGTAYLACVAVALILVAVVSPAAGPLALAAIFGEHLALAGLVFLPFVLGRPGRRLLLALLVTGAIAVGRFGGAWWSAPDRPNGAGLTVMTFNLEIQSRAAQDAVAFLRAHPADVVGLQELTGDVAAAIADDPDLAARYPHTAMHPQPHPFGSGILSRYPLRDVVLEETPARLAATVETPDGPVRILDGHPPPPGIARGPLGMPVGFDPARRDELNGEIRAWIDSALAGPDPVVVLGDFNTAAGEPQFRPLAAGLHDAHADAGIGPGWTYRPSALAWLGFGLVRIDLVLAGPGLRPVASSVACPARGDHCAVVATLVRDAAAT